MRLLLYNIRYGTGSGPILRFPLPGISYLRNPTGNLARITSFIRDAQPDIVGLIEVDSGSMRARRVNQAEAIAAALGHSHCYQIKYGEQSINKMLPVVRKQANAFLTSARVTNERFHYFDAGIKRLIMELELDDVCIFLVHLSLKYRHRHYQLRHLHSLVKAAQKPVIVAGDFNTLWGDYEIHLFMEAAGLRNANTRGLSSFPSWAPRMQLDFILYSEGIEIDGFDIPRITLSDHLPLVCDFRVTGRRGMQTTA